MIKLNRYMQQLVDDIAGLCSPEQIYLFSVKVNMGGEVTSFKLCVIADTQSKTHLEQKIYLSLDCELPYDVVIYTADEWKAFMKNPLSFAHSIIEKGWKVYDKAPQ